MYYVHLLIWKEQVLVSVEKVVMYVAAEHYRAVGRSENLGGEGDWVAGANVQSKCFCFNFCPFFFGGGGCPLAPAVPTTLHCNTMRI